MKEETSRTEEIRRRTLAVAQGIRSVLSTSLGPRGMDKMITQGDSTTVTNDGSTILKMMKMRHPVAQLISSISHAQDEKSGDGTTSVALLTASLVEAAQTLISQNVHPVVIAEAMELAKKLSQEAIRAQALEVDSEDKMKDCIKISLNSKIVNAYINKITEVTMSALRHVAQKDSAEIDITKIQRVKIRGGMEDTQMVHGIVLSQPLKRNIKFAPRKMRVAFLQCTLSQVKPYMDSKITVGTYEGMEEVIRQEKVYVLSLCKSIREKGIDLVVIQKSILKESLSELALHFLDRMGVLVVDGVERKEIETYVEYTGIQPVTDVTNIKEEMVGAYAVEEIEDSHIRIEVDTNVCTVILKGTDDVILEEVDRSFNDAVNVGRLVLQDPKITYGGGVPELVAYTALSQYADPSAPKASYCVRELARALLVVPEMLAVNAGADSISSTEELIQMHAKGQHSLGVSVKSSGPGDMRRENVVQPLGVSHSSISAAFDGASTLIRIDDYVISG